MATPAAHINRFRLPPRARLTTTASGELPARIALADRIADLPGIETVESSADTLPREVRIFLKGPGGGRTIRPGRRPLLCTLSREGLVVNGLSPGQKHQVLSRGWGKLVNDDVLVFLPRNNEELETCWDILRSAYDSLFDASAANHGTVRVSVWDLPRFSRTTLQ